MSLYRKVDHVWCVLDEANRAWPGIVKAEVPRPPGHSGTGPWYIVDWSTRWGRVDGFNEECDLARVR